MRKNTKNIVSVLSLGVLGISWSLGQSAQTGPQLAAPDVSSTPAPASEPSSSASAGPSAPNSADPSPSDSPKNKNSTSATPAAAKSVSKTGGVVGYKVQGYDYQIQLKVTKKGSEITDVGLVIAEATNFGNKNYTVAFPYLQQSAVAANGSSFANVSGATYTSEAFKKALDSALAKF